MSKMIRTKIPISSGRENKLLPPLLDFIQYEGYTEFAASLLPLELSESIRSALDGVNVEAPDIFGIIKEFFKEIEILRTVGVEELNVPIMELHRPKVAGCKSTYQQIYNTSTDFSFNVKIFGFGGGASKEKDFSIEDTFETSTECLRLTIPVTVEWQECKSRYEHTRVFLRSNITRIRNECDLISLGQDLDRCIIRNGDSNSGLPQIKSQYYRGIRSRARLKWGRTLRASSQEENLRFKDTEDIYSVNIPDGVIATRKLTIRDGKSAEISLETKVGGTEIGPKAILKSNKTSEYTYTLVGPHRYRAILGGGETYGIGYYWTWF